MPPTPPAPSILFRFNKATKPNDPKADQKQFRESLSALVFAAKGKVAFLGGDETVQAEPSIERLLRQADGNYAAHESFPLSSFLALPDDELKDGRVGEIDIEGLSIDDGWLWVTGSFSCNRKKPTQVDGVADRLKSLGQVRLGKNRFFPRPNPSRPQFGRRPNAAEKGG
jgi:hypothetical protein